MTCPAPLGEIPKEDCHEIADDFGALDVSGALTLAGQGRDAGPRVEAVRAVASLAASIKEQRVKLCEQYVKCKVPVADHEAQDKVLTGAMRSLIDLWNKRRFSGTNEVVRFRQSVRALDLRVNGDPAAGAPAPVAKPPRAFKAEAALARIEDPGIAFRMAGDALGVSAEGKGSRDALRTKGDVVTLVGGHRYRVKVAGEYAPKAEPLVGPGQEVVARVKYRATQPAELIFALRSLEDMDGNENAETFKVAPNDRGQRDVKLTADPQQSGFFVAVMAKGAPVEIEQVDFTVGGKHKGVAAGSSQPEPGAPATPRIRCTPGSRDCISWGMPTGYLQLTLRDSAGERSTLRTLSLQGGRSVDAALREDGGELVITLVGAGSATIQTIEVTDLGGS
jgi:hypothetical protein